MSVVVPGTNNLWTGGLFPRYQEDEPQCHAKKAILENCKWTYALSKKEIWIAAFMGLLIVASFFISFTVPLSLIPSLLFSGSVFIIIFILIFLIYRTVNLHMKSRALFNLCSNHLNKKKIPAEILFLEGGTAGAYIQTKRNAAQTLLRRSQHTLCAGKQSQLKRLIDSLSFTREIRSDNLVVLLLERLFENKFKINKIIKSINELKSGESVYILGGTEDHGVVYSFGLDEKGYYFRIYNPGGGATCSPYHNTALHRTAFSRGEVNPRATIRVRCKKDLQDTEFLKTLTLILDNRSMEQDVYPKIQRYFAARKGRLEQQSGTKIHRLQTTGSCSVTSLQIASHDIITESDLRRQLKLQEITSLVQELGGQEKLKRISPSFWKLVDEKYAAVRKKLQTNRILFPERLMNLSE